MKHLVVTEHTRIERGRPKAAPTGDGRVLQLDGRLYDRLHSYDRKKSRDGNRVFDWSDGYFRTTQWVGVMQLPGLLIEVLPKVDRPPGADDPTDGDPSVEARRNLLFMLAVGGNVPVRNRDMARLAARRAPLSETLVALFAGRLKTELLRGPERTYVEEEANLRCFKGKLHVQRQALFNAAHRERFYCRYDEFSDDTLMNRIFKASCRRLLGATVTPATQDILRQCLLLLDGAADAPLQDADFGRISLTRQNERFLDLLNFCRLLLAGKSPTVEAGKTRTFSLLFDMNTVFERFIAEYVKRYVAPRITGIKVFPQALRHRRHLLWCDQRGVLRLMPDLLIEGPEQRLIMDTKWKQLTPGNRGRGGVSDGDLYQLHAYTRRYGCQRSILLYPYIQGLEPKDFDVIDGDGQLSGERICIRQIRLHRNLDLENERAALTQELESILRQGLFTETENE